MFDTFGFLPYRQKTTPTFTWLLHLYFKPYGYQAFQEMKHNQKQSVPLTVKKVSPACIGILHFISKFTKIGLAMGLQGKQVSQMTRRPCKMYNVQRTMYILLCTMYNVQCTMYIVHVAKLGEEVSPESWSIISVIQNRYLKVIYWWTIVKNP